jgi:hypothetical protein
MSNEEGIPQGATDLPPFPILGTERDIGRKLSFGPGEDMSPADCEIVAYGPPQRDVYFYKEIVPVEEAQEGPRRFRHLEVQVRSEEFGSVKLFTDQPIWDKSGSKLPVWAGRLGADEYNHKYEDLIGKRCAVVVSVFKKRDGTLGNRLEDILGIA